MSFIYIIGTDREDALIGGPIKVGITGSVAGRLSSIQTGNPNDLSVIFQFRVPNHAVARAIEREFWEINGQSSMKGEWYNMRPGDAALSMCAVLQSYAKRFPGNLGEEGENLIRALYSKTDNEKRAWTGISP